MKFAWILLSALSPMLLGQNAQEAPKPKQPKVLQVGVTVPEDLSLMDVDGQKVTMKELRGKAVMFAWYSFNCPTLRAAGPKINQLAKDYAGNKEVAVFTINSDFRELADAKPEGKDKNGNPLKPYQQIRNHWAKKKMILPALVDPGNKIADYFQAQTTPHVFVVNSKGVLCYSGALDNDPRGRKKPKDLVNYADLALRSVLSGEKVATPITKPYG